MDTKQLKMFQIAGGVFLVCAVVIFFTSGLIAAAPMAIGGVALIIIASQTTPKEPSAPG